MALHTTIELRIQLINASTSFVTTTRRAERIAVPKPGRLINRHSPHNTASPTRCFCPLHSCSSYGDSLPSCNVTLAQDADGHGHSPSHRGARAQHPVGCGSRLGVRDAGPLSQSICAPDHAHTTGTVIRLHPTYVPRCAPSVCSSQEGRGAAQGRPFAVRRRGSYGVQSRHGGVWQCMLASFPAGHGLRGSARPAMCTFCFLLASGLGRSGLVDGK